jgi:hypothetical protein
MRSTSSGNAAASSVEASRPSWTSRTSIRNVVCASAVRSHGAERFDIPSLCSLINRCLCACVCMVVAADQLRRELGNPPLRFKDEDESFRPDGQQWTGALDRLGSFAYDESSE